MRTVTTRAASDRDDEQTAPGEQTERRCDDRCPDVERGLDRAAVRDHEAGEVPDWEVVHGPGEAEPAVRDEQAQRDGRHRREPPPQCEPDAAVEEQDPYEGHADEGRWAAGSAPRVPTHERDRNDLEQQAGGQWRPQVIGDDCCAGSAAGLDHGRSRPEASSFPSASRGRDAAREDQVDRGASHRGGPVAGDGRLICELRAVGDDAEQLRNEEPHCRSAAPRDDRAHQPSSLVNRAYEAVIASAGERVANGSVNAPTEPANGTRPSTRTVTWS